MWQTKALSLGLVCHQVAIFYQDWIFRLSKLRQVNSVTGFLNHLFHFRRNSPPKCIFSSGRAKYNTHLPSLVNFFYTTDFWVKLCRTKQITCPVSHWPRRWRVSGEKAGGCCCSRDVGWETHTESPRASGKAFRESHFLYLFWGHCSNRPPLCTAVRPKHCKL